MKCDRCGRTFQDGGASTEWVAGKKVATNVQTNFDHRIYQTTYTDFLPITINICQECCNEITKTEFEKAEKIAEEEFISTQKNGPFQIILSLFILAVPFGINYFSGNGLYLSSNDLNGYTVFIFASGVFFFILGIHSVFFARKSTAEPKGNLYTHQRSLADKKATQPGRDEFWSKEYFDKNLKPQSWEIGHRTAGLRIPKYGTFLIVA